MANWLYQSVGEKILPVLSAGCEYDVVPGGWDDRECIRSVDEWHQTIPGEDEVIFQQTIPVNHDIDDK